MDITSRAPLPPTRPIPMNHSYPSRLATWSFRDTFASRVAFTESDPAMLNIGMEMTVTAVARNGTLTYAFAPTSSVNKTNR